MSDYFPNAQNFNITGGNWCHIGRDQYNYYTTTVEAQSGLLIRGTDEEEAEFEQYHEVKRADVELHRSICNYKPEKFQTEYRLRYDCEKKFFAGEIARGNGQGSGLTIVGYEGPEAREAWLEDFKKCTGFLNIDSARLLAISRSKIPLLIFAQNLVPAVQLLINVGYLGRAYFNTLSKQLGCGQDEVWLDSQKGVLCRGPQGPYIDLGWWGWGPLTIGNENIPSSVELLQEEVFVRFLAGLKSRKVDQFAVQLVAQVCNSGWHFTNPQFAQPTVFSSFANIPISSGVNRWHDSSDVEGALLENGQTRIKLDRLMLDPFSTEISLWSSNPWELWLSQAWSVFNALGISLEDDLSQYKLIVPSMRLDLSLSRSPSKFRRRQYWPWSIYLFIRPLPSTPLLESCTTTSLHYCSHDEDGQSPLSADMCNHLGLPVVLKLKFNGFSVYSWTNDIYNMMHQYQVARGFKPSTTDFAQSLQYPADFEPIQNDSDRFREIEGKDLTPDESDIDTDLGASDTDTDTHSDFFDSDACSILGLNPYDIDAHGYNDYRDIYNKPSYSNSSPFENLDSSSPDVDDLCARFADLALV